jgi:hypothetical protein
MFVLATLLVGSQLMAVADSVPVFDVKKSCQGSEILSIVVQRNADACKQSEEATRDQLKKSWGSFLQRTKWNVLLPPKKAAIRVMPISSLASK